MGVSEREERERGEKRLFKEIIAESFLNLERWTPLLEEPQARSIQRRPIQRHTEIKVLEVKAEEGILKVTREKQFVTHEEAPKRLSAKFSIEAL